MLHDSLAFSGFSTNDIARAKAFYGDTLGLEVTEENGMLRLHLATGGMVVIDPKPNHAPATFTILNLPVPDIAAAIDQLMARGVSMERYEGLDQDERGIAEDQGPKIAWFTDPAGNVIALLQA